MCRPCRIERLERRAAVEHHHHGIDAFRPAAFAQAASRRDQERLADVVERQRMRRAQRLDRGDAGHDLDIRQGIEPPRNAQRGIVQRGIAPDQQRDLAVTAEMICDRLRPGSRQRHRANRPRPCDSPLHRHRAREDRTRRCASFVGEHIGADRPPEIGKIGFCRPLARDQDEIGRIDCADRGARELPGIAATDAYQGEREHRGCEGRPITAARSLVS